MPKPKGEKMKHHTPEEKAALVEQVCEFYESQNATIESCCHAAGISENAFRLWLAQNGEFAERYKKAKQIQDNAYWQEIIRPLAKTAMQRRLEGETKTETKSEGEWKGDGKDRVFVEKKRTETKSEILPDTTLTIFAMKGIYPKMFADRHEHSGPDSGPINVAFDVERLSDKEADLLLDLMEKTKNG